MTGHRAFGVSGEAPILDIRNLSVQFPQRHGSVRVVEGVSLTIDRGQIVGLVGESGSGKTMTALSIAQLVPSPGRIDGGEIWFQGRDLVRLSAREMRRVRGDRVGFVFQDPMTSLNPVLTIGEQLTESLRAHLAMSSRASADRAVELMARVGIPSPRQRLRDYPHQFSGGMRQRVMVAIAIACEPDLILADEPTTALDATIQAQILELIGSLSQQLGAAVLFITHDLAAAATLCNRIDVMYAGRIVERGGTEIVLRDPEMPYTQALLASLPSWEDEPQSRLAAIEGLPPDPASLPQGCKFIPRCPHARAICSDREPDLTARDRHGHLARCWGTEEGGWLQ